MENKIFISLKNDLLFKEAFTHIDNRKFLIYFLTAVTDFSYDYLMKQDIKVNYDNVLTKCKECYKNKLDDIIIEFDNCKINLKSYSSFNQEDFYKSASYIMGIFYPLLEKSYKNHQPAKRVIQINLVDNVLCHLGNNINTNYYLTSDINPNIKIFKDKFVIKIFRLDKAKEAEYNKDNLEVKWLKFIIAETEEERKFIAKDDELLTEFDNWLEKFVNDKNNTILLLN